MIVNATYVGSTPAPSVLVALSSDAQYTLLGKLGDEWSTACHNTRFPAPYLLYIRV